MKTRLAFWLTERERDALLVLGKRPAAWKTFRRATWDSLAVKRLVNVVAGRPVPTDAGRHAIALTQVLATLTCLPDGQETNR